jgi:NTE family protein
VSLANAIAASSAFPPFLSPAVFKANPSEWKSQKGSFLFDNIALRQKVVLTDGGVYDNMGMEAIWRNFTTVLISDAGAPMAIKDDPASNWLGQVTRALDITTEQTRALRKRRLIQDSKDGVRQGTYWGITTHINDYGLPDAMTTDSDTTMTLQLVRTRLSGFSDEEQGRLINWGYALADAAMRRHVHPNSSVEPKWPVPAYAL